MICIISLAFWNKEGIIMMDMLSSCKLCPKNCGVNRLNGELGFCRAGRAVKVARAALHLWEEPCISGTQGSGTVFFSQCNLKCVFCQNHEISTNGAGMEVSIERLSEIFIEQQQRGALNINLVTPTHYVPQIIDGVKLAREKGLTLPIVYNTNSYENIETIKALQGIVDIYLPDLKFFDDRYAVKYSNAPNYFQTAAAAIKEMVTQVGEPKFNEDGIIKNGVIIRHLMLPGLLFDSKKIVDFIYGTFGDSVYLSLMNQYTPMHNSNEFKELNRPLNPKHYDSLVDYCLELGVTNGFIQQGGTVGESFVPAFDLKGVR